MVQTQQSLQMLAVMMAEDRHKRDTQQGYRQLIPKGEMTNVTAANRNNLIDELTRFEIDINELGMDLFSEASFYQLRAVASGRAKDVIEYELALGPQLRRLQGATEIPVDDPRRD